MIGYRVLREEAFRSTYHAHILAIYTRARAAKYNRLGITDPDGGPSKPGVAGSSPAGRTIS